MRAHLLALQGVNSTNLHTLRLGKAGGSVSIDRWLQVCRSCASLYPASRLCAAVSEVGGSEGVDVFGIGDPVSSEHLNIWISA